MVFISHKSDPDHKLALMLKSLLEKNGVSCWIAPESVGYGEDYAAQIPWAIKSCEIFLLILSPDAQNSIHVRKELDIALRQNKRIVPVKYGDFEINESFEYLLTNVQTKPLLMDDSGLLELIDICKLGEREVCIEINRQPSRKLTVIKGGYSENMDHFIQNYPEELHRTVFAMGIDCTSDISISSTKGILKSVCTYLFEKYQITIEYLQRLVDDAKIKQLAHSGAGKPLRYKDIIVIRVPLGSQQDKPMELQLMLVANSKKNDTYYITHDVDEVEGIDSREIVIEVFNKCKQLGDTATNLFIGAMGTNGLSFPYEVITAEILNCYVFSYRMNSVPQNLFYSIREDDMMKAGLTIDEIMSYISTVTSFFRK